MWLNRFMSVGAIGKIKWLAGRMCLPAVLIQQFAQSIFDDFVPE